MEIERQRTNQSESTADFDLRDGSEPVHPIVDLLDRFGQTVTERPDEELFHFVDDQGQTSQTMTRSQLDTHARQIAALLDSEGLKPGDRVLLVYSFSLDVVAALLGCLYAGVIPCPTAPPNLAQLQGDLDTFEKLAQDSGAEAVLTNGQYRQYRRLASIKSPLLTRKTKFRDMKWLRTDADLPAPVKDRYRPSGHEVAFIQYTSGSTSAPKGVLVTFDNLSAQLAALHERCELHPASTLVAWIPYYHDYCLVGGIINVLFGHGQLYLMSPMTFLKTPSVWFDLMHRVRATGTAAPNFGFDYAVRKTTEEQRKKWNLSCVDIFQSGGEPILAESVDAFFDAFAVTGLRRASFGPCYGMAEHVLGIAMMGQSRIRVDQRQYEQAHRVVVSDDPNAKELVGNGKPLVGVRIEIVDPDNNTVVGPNDVGEIWVSSDSKAAGYWQQPELSESDLGAHLAGDQGGDRFLRTGDLGFFHEGELFVSGRIKDTIILRGRNIYPQDVEALVSNAHGEIRPGRSVAFAHPGTHGEHLAVITELRNKQASKDQLESIVDEIRRQVAAGLGVACETIVLVGPNTISKTSSGKPQRSKTRSQYLLGELATKIVGQRNFEVREPPSNERLGDAALTEELVLGRLAAQVAFLDGRDADDIDVDVPIDSFAIDSLAIMGIVLELSRWSGRTIAEETLHRSASLREFARAVVALDAAEPAQPLAGDEVDALGKEVDARGQTARFPLNPSQAWMFEPDGPPPQGWTLRGMLQAPRRIDVACMQQALDVVVANHEALRMRLMQTEHGWQQVLLPSDDPSVTTIDLRGLRGVARRDQIERIAADTQSTLHMTNGPIVALVVLHLDDSEADRVMLVIHHCAVDAYSAELVATEIIGSYEKLCAGEPPTLLAPPVTYSTWMTHLLAMAESDEVGASAERIRQAPVASRLQPDDPQGSNTDGDYEAEACSLSEQVSHRLLHELPSETGLPAAILVLSALTQALHQYRGDTHHGFELVHHGRGDAIPRLDLSRTCGWLSVNSAVTLVVDPQLDSLAQARSIQATINAVPRNGLDYSLLAFVHPDRSFRSELRSVSRPEMKFMWFGQSLGAVAALGDRYPMAPELLSPTTFEPGRDAHYQQYFYGTILGGRIRLDVGSSRHRFTQQTRRDISAAWHESIVRLVEN